MRIAGEEFEAVISVLQTLKISHAWKGYGSAIFLELGPLRQQETRNNARGASTVAIYWDWRVESDLQILGGSSHTGRHIQETLKSLIGAEISAISIWMRRMRFAFH